MTLIISKSSRNFVLQVTDRLISTRLSPNSFEAFDEFSNKNIIFCAINGILSFAYTGVAYIENTPTDQWLADKLIGENFSLQEPPPSCKFGPVKVIYTGPALQILRDELERAWKYSKRDLIENRFDLCFEGYVWNKKRKWRPFNGVIYKPPYSNLFYIQKSNRFWYYEARITGAPAANVTKDNLQRLTDEIRNKEPLETENIISEFFRKSSEKNKTIGSDIIFIFIPSPSEAHIKPITIKFLSKSERTIILPSLDSPEMLKAAYSPWIIGPNLVLPPAILGNTGFIAHLGRCIYKVKFEGPIQPGDGMYHSGQPRKKFL